MLGSQCQAPIAANRVLACVPLSRSQETVDSIKMSKFRKVHAEYLTEAFVMLKSIGSVKTCYTNSSI